MSEVGADFFMTPSLERQAASYKREQRFAGFHPGCWRHFAGGAVRTEDQGWLITRQSIAALEAPGADDFQAVDIGQVAGEGGIGRGQAHDALRGLVEYRLAG